MEAIKRGTFLFLPKGMNICENILTISTEMNIYNKWKKELWHAFLTEESAEESN